MKKRRDDEAKLGASSMAGMSGSATTKHVTKTNYPLSKHQTSSDQSNDRSHREASKAGRASSFITSRARLSSGSRARGASTASRTSRGDPARSTGARRGTTRCTSDGWVGSGSRERRKELLTLVCDAVGRGRDGSGVWNADGTGMRLGVGRRLTVRASVGTNEIHVVTLARLENTILSSIGDIEITPNTIKDVLAVVLRLGSSGVASLVAEAVAPEEEMPFDDLSRGAGPDVGEDEATDGVSTEVGTVGVHLSSPVTLEDVDLGLVDVADGLDVVGCADPLDTGQGALWDETGAVSWLSAPCHHGALDVANLTAVLGRSPQAEV
jgi:hypothetical protein